MMGGRGREIDCGEFINRPALKWVPVKDSSVPRSPLHMAWAIRSVSSSISKRVRRGGIGNPRASLSDWFQAAPIPSQARPPERTSRVVAALTQSPGSR